jgi:hypothetical protein
MREFRGVKVQEPIVIISAEIAGADYYQNNDRTNELRYELLQKGYSIVGIVELKDAIKKRSFIVVATEHEPLLELAKKFSQKSIVVSDLSRNTKEVPTSVEETTHFGKLYPTTKEAALQAKYYLSFTEDGKDHFYTTGEKTDEKTA